MWYRAELFQFVRRNRDLAPAASKYMMSARLQTRLRAGLWFGNHPNVNVVGMILLKFLITEAFSVAI